jgi:hypothetical protein
LNFFYESDEQRQRYKYQISLCCSAGQKRILLIQTLVKKFSLSYEKLRKANNTQTSFGQKTKIGFVLYAAGQVTETDANLLANTRLSAPLNVGCGPSVEAMMGVAGRLRQIVPFTAFLISSEISGQARTIGPPTITASGARP